VIPRTKLTDGSANRKTTWGHDETFFSGVIDGLVVLSASARTAHDGPRRSSSHVLVSFGNDLRVLDYGRECLWIRGRLSRSSAHGVDRQATWEIARGLATNTTHPRLDRAKGRHNGFAKRLVGVVVVRSEAEVRTMPSSSSCDCGHGLLLAVPWWLVSGAEHGSSCATRARHDDPSVARRAISIPGGWGISGL